MQSSPAHVPGPLAGFITTLQKSVGHRDMKAGEKLDERQISKTWLGFQLRPADRIVEGGRIAKRAAGVTGLASKIDEACASRPLTLNVSGTKLANAVKGSDVLRFKHAQACDRWLKLAGDLSGYCPNQCERAASAKEIGEVIVELAQREEPQAGGRARCLWIVQDALDRMESRTSSSAAQAVVAAIAARNRQFPAQSAKPEMSNAPHPVKLAGTATSQRPMRKDSDSPTAKQVVVHSLSSHSTSPIHTIPQQSDGKTDVGAQTMPELDQPLSGSEFLTQQDEPPMPQLVPVASTQSSSGPTSADDAMQAARQAIKRDLKAAKGRKILDDELAEKMATRVMRLAEANRKSTMEMTSHATAVLDEVYAKRIGVRERFPDAPEIARLRQPFRELITTHKPKNS